MEASEHGTTTSAGSNGTGGGQSPWAAHAAAATSERPELPVIAAFVGGFVFARLLKAFGGGDDD
ncbi:MAG TPA: hypothetical protein VH300_07610 [Thermoleophilaceae bacterium]|jgi:hypothetical protein|nr:hypothetical protein [Thermoleophilaceae bacterium]